MLLRADCRRCGGCWGVLLPDRESSGRLDVVPVLLSEGVGLLLETLLALRETLVLADSHDCDVWAFLLVRFDEVVKKDQFQCCALSECAQTNGRSAPERAGRTNLGAHVTSATTNNDLQAVSIAGYVV